MKRIVVALISACICVALHAQIGYQVSLLNTATGEPRANERVTAEIKLHNCDDAVVYSEMQTGVTNDFGVLSLSIGNAQSLSAIDWSKYPMFISVTVDGVLIGKTQVMSVPYANAVVPLSKDLIVGTWKRVDPSNQYLYLYTNNTWETRYEDNDDDKYGMVGSYEIEGNTIYFYSVSSVKVGRIYNGSLFMGGDNYIRI
ncbi:MAG: hypothetical protein Q4F34_05090 [Prevotellaceae bacterium]|nr:hypothetical protein [Prevotellaceae bacterium]